MRLSEEPDVPLQINIVPMIDVIFAILTFFIISTLFLTRSEGLPVNLPKAGTADAQKSTRITVTVNPDGEIFLNQQAIALKQLQPSVRALMQTAQSNVIVINADEAVAHGQVIAVMDQLREIENAKLGIATRPPTSQPATAP